MALSDDSLQETADEDKFLEILVMAKFYSGIADGYSTKEEEKLRTWFGHTKNTTDELTCENIITVYEKFIIKHKAETRNNRYPHSILKDVFYNFRLSPACQQQQ